MNSKHICIGLFGFGTVGRGLFDVLNKIGSKNVEIKRICIKNINKERGVNASFTNNPDDIFNDKSINFIVELVDDATASYEIVCQALRNKLPVVSGNKKMLAAHLPELIKLQKENDTALLYDASACGSIPVIRNLEEYYDNDLLTSVKGILNGSSNYILWKMFMENKSYAESLKQAQDLGFAESNPTLDVEGWDSLYKLIIITVHAFGVYIAPDKIFNYGISNISNEDVRFSKEKGRRIKLVAHVEKLNDNKLIMCVMPQLISPKKYIYNVEDEWNGVVIKGLFYDKQFMFGKGAGGYPTGSAVLSDITACLYNYKYEYKKLNHSILPNYTMDVIFRVYYRYKDNSNSNVLHFEHIQETFNSEDYKYIIGNIKLQELYTKKDKLSKINAFVAAFPND